MKPKIVIHFKKDISVTINDKRYEGKDVEFPSMKIAAEVVRIAKGSYGNDIL